MAMEVGQTEHSAQRELEMHLRELDRERCDYWEANSGSGCSTPRVGLSHACVV